MVRLNDYRRIGVGRILSIKTRNAAKTDITDRVLIVGRRKINLRVTGIFPTPMLSGA